MVSGLEAKYEFPHDKLDTWKVESPWVQSGNRVIFSASTSKLVEQCRRSPEAFVEFPSVYYSAQMISVDSKSVFTFGDPTFSTLRSVYVAPVINCRDVGIGNNLRWVVISPSKYFARVSFFPRVTQSYPKSNFFYETLNIVAAGSLIIMAILCFIIFWGKISNTVLFSFAGSSIFFAGYFITTVAMSFLIDWDFLKIHKISDSSLWVGQWLLMRIFVLENLLPKRLFQIYTGFIVIALMVIATGKSVDDIQLGTNFPFMVTLGFLLVVLLRIIWRWRTATKKKPVFLQFLALAINISMAINDILVVTGVTEWYLAYSIGVIAVLFFLALSVHERIIETYRERDYLRENLEVEVKAKTSDLSKKTELLEAAMLDLRITQAELIQSAKLASLGTLAAGIAHEINNSLNFVNGALWPLEKLIHSQTAEHANSGKITKLISTMKEGLNLTFEIIKSLKNYTGLNHAPSKNLNVKELIDSVLVILKNQIREKYQVQMDMPNDLVLPGNIVGLNQILMNLIVNACDSMPHGGLIKIRASDVGEQIRLEIEDEGSGINDEIKERIFDPFFTTKDVGRGTGLGLHIVKMEVAKHHGSIQVHSKVGKGTCFELFFPKQIITTQSNEVKAA